LVQINLTDHQSAQANYGEYQAKHKRPFTGFCAWQIVEQIRAIFKIMVPSSTIMKKP
jgi:hypothetical protein